MTNTTSFYSVDSQLTPVDAAYANNVIGTYYNGPSNNGVNATLTVPGPTLLLDGVTLKLGDRALLFGQTNTYENGIYYVYLMNGINVVLKRSNDFQSSAQMKPGYFTTIKDGSAEGGGMATVVEPQAINIGTDSINFVTMNSGSSGQTVYSNTGLKVYDLADTTYYLTWKPGSVFSENRVFNIVVNDSDRTLTLNNNVTLNQSLATTSSVSFNSVTTSICTIDNNGLKISDIASNDFMAIKITENLTSNRVLNFLLADGNRSLHLNFDTTVNFQGAILPQASSKIQALGSLGIHYGLSGPVTAVGTFHLFVTPGVAADDIVYVSVLSSTTLVSITKAEPGSDSIVVFFDNIPGANTTIQYFAIAPA